jgi:cytochrome P450
MVPMNFRMSENDDEINGHKFKGSTMIFININEIHMSELYWDEPKKFKPERFLSSTNGDDKIKKNTFMMFGGGTRICPARHLAMTELKTMMVLLFGKYNVELTDYSAPLKTHCTISKNCDELKVKLVPRN